MSDYSRNPLAGWAKKRSAGFGACGLVVRPHELAVDEDFFDAGGEFIRLGEGGVVEDGVGIEEDKVSVATRANGAAILPSKPLGRE